MDTIKLLLVGCGNVGKSFIKLLSSIEMDEEIGFVGIIDRKLGSFISNVPIAAKEIYKFLLSGYTFEDFVPSKGTILRDLTFDSIVDKVNMDVMIEATTTNYNDGEPAITYIKKAFEKGAHVITANKGPVGFAYNSLKDVAREKNLEFKFESTVMSGTPLFSLIKYSLKGCKIERLRGVLNGTSNFIFSKMEEDKIEFEDALKLAKEKGYTEKDYSIDLKGIDAKLKTVILANVVMGGWLKIGDIPDVSLEGIDLNKIEKGLEENRRYKLVSDIKKDGDKILGDISLELIDNTDPLYSVSLNYNKVVIYTDILGKIIVGGPGSGPDETAYGIISDLLEIIRGINGE